MNFDELFTRTVAMLPDVVRERLDGEFPLDWTALEDAGTGLEVGEAARVRRCLPSPVEALVQRLISDLGIVPADVAAGIERPVVAGAWIGRVTMEADGESYQLRNERSGEVHVGIHPEFVAGYATLGMDLAILLHQVAERWLEAAAHHRTVPETERGALGRCAVRIHEHLQAQPATISGHRTAASLARALEHAWNTQDFEVRETLSGIRLSTARGARAPRRSYFAPVTGHRLYACDAGELRWLLALAGRAAAGAEIGDAGRVAHEGRATGEAGRAPHDHRATGEAGRAPHDHRATGDAGRAAHDHRATGDAERTAHDHRATGDAGRAAHDLRVAGDGPGAAAGRPGVRGGGISASRRGPGGPGRGERLPATLALGSDPAGVTPATEVAELVRAAHDLPGTVRERLGEAYGVKVADAVGRLQDSRITSALRTALEKAPQGQTAPVVPWLANLASALLEDAGVQTRDGVRTARARLEAGQRPEDPHRAIEVESGAFGYLAPCGLIEQIRLGFAYAHDAWAGLAALRNTGREGEWALNEADSESNQLAGDERETLEAARDIGLALGRIERARAAAHDGGPPSALEQAEMAAQTLRAVGPTVRTAAGWPGGAPPPNARSPEDVAQIAMVAEGLHGEIRAIANRLIAGWVAEAQAHGESRHGESRNA